MWYASKLINNKNT